MSSFFKRVYHNTKKLFRLGSYPHQRMVSVQPNGPMLQDIMDLIANKILKPVVDRRFLLKDAIAAFEYLETGHASGKVIIIVSDNTEYNSWYSIPAIKRLQSKYEFIHCLGEDLSYFWKKMAEIDWFKIREY